MVDAVEPVQRSSFVERRPVAPLAAHVATAWVQRFGAGAESYVQRSIPHGGVEVSCVLGDRLVLTGPRSRATSQLLPIGATVVGVRFEPWAGGAVSGTPANLVDGAVAGEQVWGHDAQRIAERMATATDPRTAADDLQRWIAARVAFESRSDHAIEHLLRASAAGQVGSVAAARRRLHISERHLRRRCRDVTGSSPAALLRVMRFQRFLALAQRTVATRPPDTGRSLASMATACGYADHAHLTRGCRRLTGEPPSTYLDVTVSSCRCGHDHRASFERFTF
jgi:AraC-like DNA-binding protein